MNGKDQCSYTALIEAFESVPVIMKRETINVIIVSNVNNNVIESL